MPEKPAVSFRLTEKAQALLVKIADEAGIAQSAVIETMIRERAKAEGISIEEEEKVFPGYVLVDMIVDDQSWFVVRNTPRVTGFVGAGVVPVLKL